MRFKDKVIFVTGGAGFIGSAVVRHLLRDTEARVVNVDKLTYAANLDSLPGADGHPRYAFEQSCICEGDALRKLFEKYQPDAVMNLAAESHVDRSIDGPGEFIKTNIDGTYSMLEAALDHWRKLPPARAKSFRFHHVSTDEVFGSLGGRGKFHETSRYKPNSPYSASKAASDHLVRAWHETFGLPAVISNCSNNYGPFHFPEKLIPLCILKAMHGEAIPVYGKGDNVRDWLYVEDHARALHTILTQAKPGSSYNIGCDGEQKNIDVVTQICALLDEMLPDSPHRPHTKLITFVTDRPAHDKRYAMDAARLRRDLGWVPEESFDTGLRKTVRWYLDNRWWWEPIWYGRYGGTRLGAAPAAAEG
jgi:dTDP-glucose 4,6-dehydratase